MFDLHNILNYVLRQIRKFTILSANLARCSVKKWLVLFCFSGLFANANPRTDTVYLYNGDRFTGEIKSMEGNRLSFKTDRAGTIKIEWPSVAKITSNNYFDIMLISGERIFGSLSYGSGSGTCLLGVGKGWVEKNLMDVVSIDKIELKILDQISGNVSLSATYAKASNNLQVNAAFDISQRTKKFENTLKANTVFTNGTSAGRTQRSDASYNYSRFFSTRNFLMGTFRFQRNTELNIASRYQVLVGGGHYIIRKSSENLSLVLGLAANQEQSLEAPVTTTQNLEMAVAGSYHLFKFRNPKIDLTTTVATYTSLTDLGRFRLDFETRLMWEIFSDFNLTLTLYNNYDNRPPGKDIVSNDYSFSTGFAYSF